MKRRLFCLLLAVLMTLPVLVMAGCSDDDEDTATTNSSSSVKAATITLYSICEEGTTEEAISKVQDAINKITEKNFNTHVILRLYTEDKYYEALELKIEAIEDKIAFDEAAEAAQKIAAKAAKAAGVTTTPITTEEETTEKPDETLVNELGLEKTKYPKESGDQLDIFLITDIEHYKDYVDRGVLATLDEELSVNSKILADYIYPTFLSGVKMNGATYAIPNNHTVGEYEYFLINRELFDKYYFDISKITILDNLSDFINTVADKEQGYTPLLNTTESYIYYPTGSKSVFAGYLSGVNGAGVAATPRNLFGLRQYKSAENMLYELNMAGNIGTGEITEDSKFGVAIVKGDYTLKEKYEDDYYVVSYKHPVFDNNEVFSSMYAVGSYTKNVSRCMQIIESFTTDEKLRNIFQYGAENVNYEINSITGIVDILNNDYIMNPLYTGNMFKLWINNQMTEETLALANNGWENAKLQNLDSTVSPYLGFTITDEPVVDPKEEKSGEEASEEENEEAVEYMKVADILKGLEVLSDEMFAKAQSFKPGRITTEDGESFEVATLSEYYDVLATEIEDNEYFIAATDTENPNSPISQYNTWYTTLYGPNE